MQNWIVAGGKRIDLRGAQRQRYLRDGYLHAVAMCLATMFMWMIGAPFAILWAPVLIWCVLHIPWHVWAASGWVRAEPAGLRTSRLFHGRFLRWEEIDSIERKTRYGRGRVTFATVRTHSGRRYRLPAPCTTERSVDRIFERDLRWLIGRASNARGGARHTPRT